MFGDLLSGGLHNWDKLIPDPLDTTTGYKNYLLLQVIPKKIIELTKEVQRLKMRIKSLMSAECPDWPEINRLKALVTMYENIIKFLKEWANSLNSQLPIPGPTPYPDPNQLIRTPNSGHGHGSRGHHGGGHHGGGHHGGGHHGGGHHGGGHR
jgi:hypothetical protein